MKYGVWTTYKVEFMDEKENIDGYVSKDSLCRLLSNIRMRNVLTEKEVDLLRKISVAIKAMPNEIDQ